LCGTKPIINCGLEEVFYLHSNSLEPKRRGQLIYVLSHEKAQTLKNAGKI